MSLINWTGIAPKNSLSRYVDDFFNDTYRKMLNWEGIDSDGMTVPAVNVSDHDDNYELHLAAPGMKKEDFQVNINENVLVIRAERKAERKDDESAYTRREFRYHSFERRFTLPEDINHEKIKARYEDGILKVSLPKMPVLEAEREVKKIAVS
jgi:HSP20 family protein